MKQYLSCMLACASLFVASSLSGQPQTNSDHKINPSATLFDYLHQEEILELTLKTNLKDLIKNKSAKEKQPATLTITRPDGTSEKWEIKVAPRGNMRNNICYVPPLKIDFAKGDLEKKGLIRNPDDLKMVIECKSGGQYTNYVFKEYLAYKMYNIITENSFRVQLGKLTIVDSEGKHKDVETYTFLIENEDDLARRLGGEAVDTRLLSERILDPETFDQMCLFQFLIGNTDWHIKNLHNLKFFKVGHLEKLVTVGYDFDYSGFVGTGYAVPHDKLPITNVRERFFLGSCREEGTYDATIKLFQSKKEELMTLCRDFPMLDEKAKKPVISYLEAFYNILENPKKVKKMIVKHCNMHVKIG